MSNPAVRLAASEVQHELAIDAYQNWNVSAGVSSALFYRLADCYLVRFPGIADFRIEDSNGAVVCTPALASGDRWQAAYQQQIVPLTASLHGLPVYHGAAIAIDGFAVAILGASGRGKSTLAAAFAARGYPFLADDCLRLTEVDGVAFVHPDRAAIRLWDDSIDALAPREVVAHYAAGSPKAHLPAADTLPHCAETLPLGRVYVLGHEDVDAPVLAALTLAESAMAWTSNAFLLDIKSPSVLRRNFSAAGRWASLVPGRRLEYPRRYEVLDALVAAVVADPLVTEPR